MEKMTIDYLSILKTKRTNSNIMPLISKLNVSAHHLSASQFSSLLGFDFSDDPLCPFLLLSKVVFLPEDFCYKILAKYI